MKLADDAASSELLAVYGEIDGAAHIGERVAWEAVSGLASRVELRVTRWAFALGRTLLSRIERRTTPNFLRTQAGA